MAGADGSRGGSGPTRVGSALGIGETWVMQRSVACRIVALVEEPTDVALAVSVAMTGGRVLAHESLVVELDGAPLPVREVADEHGTRLHLLDGVGAGELVVAYDAVVDGQAEPDRPSAVDTTRYRRASRYCEADELTAVARAEFRDLEGVSLLEGISSWVGQRVAYVSGSSRPTDGAISTLLSRQGVCRDFAHLVVALLRACDIPARVAAVYAPGLEPMDFHAVAEALIDGRWLAVDSTLLAPRSTLVRIATGRDAADTAFLTSTGTSLVLASLDVVATTDGPLPDDDIRQPVQLT